MANNFDEFADDGTFEVEDELENFRQTWRNEVAGRQAPNTDSTSSDENVENEITQKARQLFKEGIEHERQGHLPDAVKCYRSAIHLDPEIEQHLTEVADYSSAPVDPEENPSEDEDLLSRFTTLSMKSDMSEEASTSIVTTGLNILDLPDDMLNLIFRWVASSDLDLKSVEALSHVCRKFYVISKDQSLWQAACIKVWGQYANKKLYKSWRQMYIKRPQMRLDGVYISKTTYFRQGEPMSWIPFQCVVYFRYMRFFSNGQMLFYTTAEEPLALASKLTWENAAQYKFRVGRYQLLTNSQENSSFATVTAVLIEKSENLPRTSSVGKPRRRRAQEISYTPSETKYHLSLEVSSSPKKRFNRLSWLSYSCSSVFGDSDRKMESQYNLGDQFPPLYFSKVKSFNAYSHEPL